MTTDRIICADTQFQKQIDSCQMAEWVNALAPWEVIGHFTWRDRHDHYRDGSLRLTGVSQDSARRGFEKFISRSYPKLSYFYAVEENPGREGNHVHALFADTQTVRRSAMWHEWWDIHGRNRIEPVKNKNDVASYCSKYVTKSCAWWNVKLQWHRVQALNDATFNLRN